MPINLFENTESGVVELEKHEINIPLASAVREKGGCLAGDVNKTPQVFMLRACVIKKPNSSREHNANPMYEKSSTG